MGTREEDPAARNSRENMLARFCLDHAAVSAIRLDEAGRILYANHKACETLGYENEELTQLSIWDLDPSMPLEIWPKLWQNLCDSGSTTFESTSRRKNGAVIPVEVTATLVEFDGCRYSIALFHDITERKYTIESLRIAQFVLDKASFGIFLTKEGGAIYNVNEYACQYLGYTREELCRMNILDIDRRYSKKEIEQLWRRKLKSGYNQFETVHRSKGGIDIPVSVTGNIFEFNNERYGVSFVHDITELKAAEKRHRKMEAQLREAQKMESLGTLAGGIAHDFNNILAAILGYAELAQLECPANSELERYVAQISQAGSRAKALVNQILAFSRQGRSERGPLNISRAVLEALKLIRATLPANIEIHESISPNLPPVFADETQIHQIVMNLCANAHYAMKNTGGLLEVSLTAVTLQDQGPRSSPETNPGDYLKLSIADTGHGIPADKINRIFDPYFTTKPTGEGTGLGLSTVHGIVTNHGGRITVQSEVGCGTTFQIYFPVAEAAAKVPDGQTIRLPTGHEHILFVDDEKSIIDLGRNLLERLGYRVETWASSIDAVQAFRSHPDRYDLVISDMTMPKMTGDELARHIRAIRPEIPIILCSGFSEKIQGQAVDALGINAVLMKPIIYADLANSVRQVLDIKQK